MTKEITMHKKGFLTGLALVVILALLQNAGFVADPANASGAPSGDSQPVAEATTSLVINEFVASNLAGLLDEDGDASDWIELYNAGASAVNLAGWSLTDASGDPWVFPAATVASNAYLVIFASRKNRSTAGSQLHTDFNLDAAGEYLALLDATGQPASEFSPQFPQQYADVSYGRYDSAGQLRYLSHPTPGPPTMPPAPISASSQT